MSGLAAFTISVGSVTLGSGRDKHRLKDNEVTRDP